MIVIQVLNSGHDEVHDIVENHCQMCLKCISWDCAGIVETSKILISRPRLQT